MLWRLIFAVIAVVLFYALLGPVSRLLGFPVTGDLLTVLRIAVAGIAIYYVIKGAPPR